MFLELIFKEFKKQRNFSKDKRKTFFLTLLKLIFVGAFIALEVFIFLNLDKKIEKYSSYGTYDFLVLFIFVLEIVAIVSSIVQARKVLFDKEDNRILMPLPISEGTIIASKITYIYLKEVFLNLAISSPLIITYASTRHYMPYIYVMSLLYPFIISAFNVGIALIFVTPYQYIYKVIKNNDISQFVIASLLVISLCFIYQVVLNVFLTALNDSAIGGVFDSNFIDFLHNFVVYLYPVSFFLEAVVKETNILSNISIILGSLLISLSLGSMISTFFYNKLNKHSVEFKKKEINKEMKIVSPFVAQVKKEIDVLFKDSTYIFSYTALLIMAPFLAFVVISSLNAIIYDNLRIYAVYFPELTSSISITLVLLFSSTINTSAARAMSREEKALEVTKYIPVKIKDIFLAKLLIPLILSFISLLITCLTLLISKNLEAHAFFVTLFIGTILIISSSLYGLYFDMFDKGSVKHNYSSILGTINILFPFVLLFVSFLLQYSHIKSSIMYLILCLISLILLLPFIYINKKKFIDAFKKMEVN